MICALQIFIEHKLDLEQGSSRARASQAQVSTRASSRAEVSTRALRVARARVERDLRSLAARLARLVANPDDD